MLAETRGALSGLRALARAEADLGAHAVSAAERLTRELSTVLVSLQGHDAARQMLEHATEELDAFEAELSGGAPAGADAGGRLERLCELALAQIRGARESLTGVLQSISGSLRSAAQEISSVEDRASRVGAGEGGAASAETVARGVSEATDVLGDHVAHHGETDAALRSVTETVQSISVYVRDIQGVGGEVKLIALNALVQTGRAGDGGRVLAVLARAMGDLASDVVRQTSDVSEALRRVAAEADGLARTALSAEAAQGADIAASLASLSARLSEFRRRLLAATAALRVDGAALQGDVEALVARLAEGTSRAARLAELEEALGEIAAGAAARSGGRRAEVGAETYARYTVEAERAIHDRVLARAARPPSTQPRPDPSGLGDNVELF
jgi:hypothetical protein